MNRKSLAAGLLIGLGCIVYLSTDNRYVGALLFSLGLYFICQYDLRLYTGRCGYPANWGWGLVRTLALNLAAIFIACVIVGCTHPDLSSRAQACVIAKIGKPWLSYGLDSVFCGMLMFLAVDCFNHRPKGTISVLSIPLAVPGFILSGFEHSVANMGYLALALPALSVQQIGTAHGYVFISAVGNLIGSVIMMLLLEGTQQWKKSC